MPHAVITGAKQTPKVDGPPLLKEEGLIFRVVEMARSSKGTLLKCVIIAPGEEPRKFLARLDEREDGMVAHLDDHMPVERDDDVFHFLAVLAEAVLAENPDATIGKTNLQKWLSGAVAAP